METAVLRKELHSMIDTMPDQFIKALVPLVTCITDEYWKPVIEAASPEEAAMIDERMKNYEADPSFSRPGQKSSEGNYRERH